MVIDSFSAPDLGVEGKGISLLVLSLIGIDDSPDALTSASSVLLQHSLTMREADGETFLEVFHIIVDVSVLGDQSCLVELHKGRFGSKVDHGVRMRHADQTILG